MKIYLLCGGYYTNFDYPKSLTEINDETLIDRTIRLLGNYGLNAIVCCNKEETAFDSYVPLRCNFTFDHVKQTGYYLDAFDALLLDERCIILFGDVYYTEDAIDKIINAFITSTKNIFICNDLPFNSEHRREGEPFGWIVNDVDEFKWAVKLCKKFQDRGIIDHSNGIPSNWELAHLINGLGVNDFNLNKEDCLIIHDYTIDVDAPDVIPLLRNKLK